MRKLTSVIATLAANAGFVALTLAAHAAQPAPIKNGLCDHTAVAGGHVMAWVTTCIPTDRSPQP
jgi:hypothetical protein